MNWKALFWWRPPCLLRRVLVNVPVEESTFDGVLWASNGAWLTLRDVKVLRHGADPAPMDGDMVIHRDKVSFLQVLP
jgi:hypothetical protein